MKFSRMLCLFNFRDKMLRHGSFSGFASDFTFIHSFHFISCSVIYEGATHFHASTYSLLNNSSKFQSNLPSVLATAYGMNRKCHYNDNNGLLTHKLIVAHENTENFRFDFVICKTNNATAMKRQAIKFSSYFI